MDYTISPYVQFRLALKFIIKKDWDRKQKDAYCLLNE